MEKDGQGPKDQFIDARRKELIREAQDLDAHLSGFFKKKLILWCVRWAVTILLYVVFWKYAWVRWTLLVTIPLGLASLFMIVRGKKKMGDRLSGIRDGFKAGE